MMRVPKLPPRLQRAVMQDLVEGLSFLKQSPVLMTVLLLTCIFSIFGRSYSTLLPAFAHLVLHSGSGALGLMYAMPGLGTLIGGFALAAYGDVRAKGNLIMITAVMTGVTVTAIAISSSLLILLLLLVAVGVAITVFNATVSTVLQMRAPGPMRGRVMSYNTVAWRGLTSLGGSVTGGMAQFTGTRTALAAGGVIVAVGAVLLFLMLPYLRQANADPEVLTPEPVQVRRQELTPGSTPGD
jgi:MFS family permease